MTTAALLFTDLVDSTGLVERVGDERAAQLWAEHDRRARELLAVHHGREIDRSDGFFLLFDAVADAARCALAYHAALADLGLEARVGLHVGPVTLRENAAADVARGAKPMEVEGLAKPVAARVMALARGGQTLLSAPARAALGAALPEGAAIEGHGHYRLKGVEEPAEVFELGLHDHCAFTPPPDTGKAYRVVLADDLWRPLREVRHNLPAERDAFVGRGAELRALARRLDAGARLLTVLGPGGTGKTRCVRRYGWSWLGDWPGGIYFCDLTEAKSLDGVFSAVAVALGVPLGKGDPGVQLGHAIAGRGRCLVIFDNFEQVIEHASATLSRWLDRAANASFVVTSRERLHLAGEELFAIEPLPLAREAIELFEARARAQRPDFAITDANHAAVTEVVRLLDGLPLAIELAAARVRVLSPVQLVERMRDRFVLLAGARGPAARQATLRAAIDWSWDLLAPWEQAALAQCSVFEGGFTMPAAEAVLDLGRWPEAPPVMDAVQALVDKSLLRSWVGSEPGRYDIEEPHFGMYVSIHEYARERLSAPARAAAHRRHGRYFAGFGSDEAIEALLRHGGLRRRRALAVELDNLVAACRRAVTRQDAEVAVAAYRATWEVLDLCGPFALGVELGASVFSLDEMGPSLRVVALVTRAMASRRAGRMDEAGAWLAQALVLAHELNDLGLEGMARLNLGMLHSEQGLALDKARAELETGLAIHRQVGDRRAEGVGLATLSNLYLEHGGRMEEALVPYVAALAIFREVGDRRFEGTVMGNLGMLYYEQGQLEEARALVVSAIEIAREVGDRRSEGIDHGCLGALLSSLGQTDEAMSNYHHALAIARDLGHRRHEGYVLGELGHLYLDQRRFDEAHSNLEASLAIHREVGDRRFEGIILAHVGHLLVEQGRIGAGREAFDAGEALLRQVGDRLELAKLCCVRGRIEVGAGELDVAGAALADVESLIDEIGAASGSELVRDAAVLREMIMRADDRDALNRNALQP